MARTKGIAGSSTSIPGGGISYGATSTKPIRVGGTVVLWSPELDRQLPARHAARPQVQDERTGRWRTIDRPQLRPVVTFDGYTALRVKLTLLLDGWMDQRTVEPEVELLRDFAKEKPSDAVKRPPYLSAIGAVPYPTVDWVVDTLAFDSERELTLPVSGSIARAVADVVLLEFVDSTVSVKLDRKGAAAAKPRSHTWRASDTLHALAEHYLGDERRANSIRAANPKIKRWSTIEPGTKIKIPARTS